MKEKKLKDTPLYEVEYKNGEAYVDIPDEEINEFIKNRLIQIANSPRLIEKYRHGLEDLLEKDLQEYANKQFYEEGKGEVVDSADEEPEDNSHDVELNYSNLEITQWSLTSKAVYYPNDFAHPDEYDEYEITIDWDYEVNAEDVVDFFYNNAKLFDELKDIEDGDKVLAYIYKYFDNLVDKYEEDLKEHFKQEARENAEENYEAPEHEPEPYDPYDDYY